MANKVLFEKPDIRMLNSLGFNCYDLHYHTKHSDGKNGVKISIKKANRLGFGFAVTDHNEIKGSVDAFRLLSGRVFITLGGETWVQASAL